MDMPDKNKPKDTGHIATPMNDNMDDGDEANVTVKGSCSEQRKLRSRDAARCRRGKETELFYDLARTLPLPRRISTHLDKAAIMRVTLSVLRMHRLLHSGTESPKASEEVDDDDDDEDPADVLYTQALSGFIVVITAEGDIIYLTDNVSKHIGIPQLELLGQSVYDFVHPCDQEELRDLLMHPVCSKKLNAGQLRQMNFFLRMKSTLTSKGRTVNIKSASWKVFHCTGHMRALGDSSAALPADTVMTLLCEPVPHPSSVDFPLDTHTFLTRHSMDMRFTHCEGRLGDLVGYEADDLIGRSVFEFYHAMDSVHVNKSLHTLLAKGQVSTSPYRFLASGGGFVWAETQATVLYNNKTSHAEAVVCLNFVLSAVEQSDVFFSSEQIRAGHRLKAERLDKNTDAGESCESRSPPEILLPPTAEDKDAVAPLTGDFITLSFATPRSLSNIPEDPQDLCTPQLRQLLLPIFNHDSSSSSSSSLDPEPAHSNNSSVRDTREVEKLFAFWPEDGDKMQDNMQQMSAIVDCACEIAMDGVDLDMLAPYISMDDDFQLSFFSAVPEANTDVNTEPPPEVTAINRKRAHNSDEDVLSQLMAADDKRHKHDSDATSQENQLLLSHVLLGCLTESQSEEELGTKGRSHLLADRDPIFGGMRGLCDTTSLMMDIFKSEPPPDLSPMS